MLINFSFRREWVTSKFQLMQKLPAPVRDAATEEMKKIIAHAYSTNTMLTIHWPSVQLTRSAPNPLTRDVADSVSSLNEADPLKSLKRKQ